MLYIYIYIYIYYVCLLHVCSLYLTVDCCVFITLLLLLPVFTIMNVLHYLYLSVIDHYVFIDLYIVSRGLATICY